MTTIYLIRHAEAEGNIYRRLHGHYDSVLTPNGHRQVQALQRRFETVAIDACYSSDLTRACQTAQAITQPKRLTLRTDARFREIGCGVWEDVPFGYLGYTCDAQLHRFNHSPWDWHVEGAESYEAFTARFLAALDEIAFRHEGQSVAVVSHGAVLRCVLTELFFSRQTIDQIGHCDNTGVTKIIHDAAGYRLCFLNDNTHLSTEISTLARQNWWRDAQSRDNQIWFAPASPVTLPDRIALGGEDLELYQAMLDDEPVGTLALSCAPGERRMYIAYMQVAPSYRTMAFGVQMVGQAVSEGRKVGCALLCARVPEQFASSAPFFEKVGFSRKADAGGSAQYEMSLLCPKFR